MIIDDRKRIVGKVVSVAADRLTVELMGSSESFRVVGFDDVHYVARLGSFVIIPVLADYVVAEVTGMTEREPSRRDGKSSEDLDKTASARFLEVVPLGTLTLTEFKFGVSIFPTLYADALYATESELDRIFEVKSAEPKIPPEDLSPSEGADPDPWPTRLRALDVGRSAVFPKYDVKVRVDEFFGGHIAVLGNTGSGKSCTVSSVIQSLFMKEPEYVARGATFVVLDVNGEYRRAFSKLPEPIRRHVFRVAGNAVTPLPKPLDEREVVESFILPHWFMSVEEWELLLMASERTQRPVLRTALGLASLFSPAAGGDVGGLRNHILASCLRTILHGDASAPSKHDHIIGILSSFHSDELTVQTFTDSVQMDFGRMAGLDEFEKVLDGFILENVTLPEYRPSAFAFADLGKALDMALLHEEGYGHKQIRDYCASMLTRFKWVKDREEFAFLRTEPAKVPAAIKTIESFLQRVLGLDSSKGQVQKVAQVIIIDMNENDDDAIAVVSSVVARLIFELLRKAEPRNRMPVNLVLEEAHRYIADDAVEHALDASRIFERIAKEGRKYGLFLTVASQRPSELSRTVLSQCSNFIIHRIQNPEDLSHIRQMTPFMSEAVLRRLPSLPKQHALIFGNSVNMPMTVRVRNADPTPHSADAQISKLWFHAADRTIDIASSFVKAEPPKSAKGPKSKAAGS
jgi:hypothetical protein